MDQLLKSNTQVTIKLIISTYLSCVLSNTAILGLIGILSTNLCIFMSKRVSINGYSTVRIVWFKQFMHGINQPGFGIDVPGK